MRPRSTVRRLLVAIGVVALLAGAFTMWDRAVVSRRRVEFWPVLENEARFSVIEMRRQTPPAPWLAPYETMWRGNADRRRRDEGIAAHPWLIDDSD